MILHPFVEDLSTLKLEEIQEKLAEITKKMNFALRTQNSAMIHQLRMLHYTYQDAFNKKIGETLEKKSTGTKISVS